MQKIFGFALTKTTDTLKAEELASRITYDLYISLLKAEKVDNINGYVYRVACNVYARFVDEEVRGRYVSLDEVSVSMEHDFTVDFEKEEAYVRLRREISFLGKIRREIIVMHYFQKQKLNEIARKLNIPPGTVKWHLHEARNQLKEGISKMENKMTLGMKPVRLVHLGISGMSSPDGRDTNFFLEKLIAQNIAYAAYHKARTITEIAEVLGVPAAFIEDEVSCLEENGFLDKISGDKYLTNIYISEYTKEMFEEKHEIFKKYARILKDKYVPLLFNALSDYKSKRIYTPENDFNFLMWAAAAYACRHKFAESTGNGLLAKYNVKRKNGGQYIATARVKGDYTVNYDEAKYKCPNNMTEWVDEYKVYSWQLKSCYDSRTSDYNENRSIEYKYLYEHITGRIVKNDLNAEKYKLLYDKGFLVPKDDGDYTGIVIAAADRHDFEAVLPAATDELKKTGKEMDAEIYNLHKGQYPPHMQDLCKSWSTGCLSDQDLIAYVYELLLEDGTLKPLTDTQKRSVNTIMFCDTLPK
jgi:RNA polymerase sigma factor (sigma-70 family)